METGRKRVKLKGREQLENCRRIRNRVEYKEGAGEGQAVDAGCAEV